MNVVPGLKRFRTPAGNIEFAFNYYFFGWINKINTRWVGRVCMSEYFISRTIYQICIKFDTKHLNKILYMYFSFRSIPFDYNRQFTWTSNTILPSVLYKQSITQKLTEYSPKYTSLSFINSTRTFSKLLYIDIVCAE